jgi:hypothetical protein
MKKNLIYILLALVLLSCSSDDGNSGSNSDGTITGEPFISMNINGEPLMISVESTMEGTAIFSGDESVGLRFTLAVSVLVSLTESFNMGLHFNEDDPDFNRINANYSIENNGQSPQKVECDYAVFSSVNDIISEIPINSVGDYIKITAIDRENNFVSGEFEVVTYDETTDTYYNITNGVFNKIAYVDFF